MYAKNICGTWEAMASAIRELPHNKEAGDTLTRQACYQWTELAQIPAERARDIELVTGGRVSRADLRPDLFNCECPQNVN